MSVNSLPMKETSIGNILVGDQGHLIYLIPELINCLSTKEPDLRKLCRRH